VFSHRTHQPLVIMRPYQAIRGCAVYRKLLQKYANKLSFIAYNEVLHNLKKSSLLAAEIFTITIQGPTMSREKQRFRSTRSRGVRSASCPDWNVPQRLVADKSGTRHLSSPRSVLRSSICGSVIRSSIMQLDASCSHAKA
jgi:hypothetical protein